MAPKSKKSKDGVAPAKGPTRPKPKPTTSENTNHALEDELQRLKLQLASALDAQRLAERGQAEALKAKELAETAKKEVENKAKAMGKSIPEVVIPKPKAAEMSESCDRLRRVMGLMDDKASYIAIQATIRDLVHQVRLDTQLAYRQQPAKDLGDLFRMARRFQPHLARFQNDWATAELVKQYLSNRRKNDARKRKVMEELQERADKRCHIDELGGGGEGDNTDGEQENGGGADENDRDGEDHT